MNQNALQTTLNNFLDKVRQSPHFTPQEIEQVERIKKVCDEDYNLIHESMEHIKECRAVLTVKEQELDDLLRPLSQSELNNPLIQSLIQLFGDEHEKLEQKIQKIEQELENNYFPLGFCISEKQLQSQLKEQPIQSTPLAPVSQDSLSEHDLDAILEQSIDQIQLESKE